MALRAAVASAAVSRKAGRRRHRLGAFSLGVGAAIAAAYARRVRRLLVLVSCDHLRRRAAVHRADAARPGLCGRVRPLEDRSRPARRRLRRRSAARRHPRRARRGAVRARSARSSAASSSSRSRASPSPPPTARSRSALARFVQGFSSTATWAGALAWITVVAPRARRGEMIGTAFGAAIFGAVLGPDVRRRRRGGRHPALVHDRSASSRSRFAALASLGRIRPRARAAHSPGREARASRRRASSAASG